MNKPLSRIFGALFAVLVLGVAATECAAQVSRHTPIVTAVEKTRKGIVQIKVGKPGAYTRRDIVGTGVIVDERGYVVTAHHVIADAQTIKVILHDGTSYKGVVHTEDVKHDLAILRLPGAKGLTPLPFGPGSDLMVGETVIAIGNPFGYTRTVSTGTISALERQITMPTGETLSKLTQTSAAVNPGNSGGPLLNINGEWIGVIVALRDGAQNIGFALNIDTVNEVVSRNLSAGRVARLRHGMVCGEQVSAEGKERQKVIVEQVTASSPAAEAGLRKGDVILSVADRSVRTRFDVERALWSCKAGDRVEATIVRGGRQERIALTLSSGDVPAGTAAASLPGRSR